MAISSINFKKTKDNSEAETKRKFEAKYLLKEEYRKTNEYWDCGVNERELFKQELAKSKRKGGRVPRVENSLWEGVLNLNADHTMQDVKKVADHIAKEFNIHSTRIAIHKDEGHFNIVSGKVEYNYHAHLNFMSWKDGKQNWRKEFIGENELRDLQTETAKILGMVRGQLNSTSVRAEHGEFRKNAKEIKAQRQTQKEMPSILAKQKDLREKNKQLRAELQQAHAKREQYAELETTNRILKLQIKNKELSIRELEEKIQELKNREPKIVKVPVIQKVEKKIYVENPINVELKELAYSTTYKNIDKKPAANADVVVFLEKKAKELENKIVELENQEPIIKKVEKIKEVENPVIQKQLIEARETILKQEVTISTLKSDFSDYKQNMGNLVTQNKALKDAATEALTKEQYVEIKEIKDTNSAIAKTKEYIITNIARYAGMVKELKQKNKALQVKNTTTTSTTEPDLSGWGDFAKDAHAKAKLKKQDFSF